MIDNCPHCGAGLHAEPIPEDMRQSGLYGPPETAPTHYSRIVGVEIRGVYDGVLFWRCPACDGWWHRFPEGDPRHDAAEKVNAE